ncbi:MAG TPA: HEAT repeat domain-containing protein [Chloroflexia bacterium]|nr:HEAT repeat domain-containing protein [Chloroflexia bacterium]
MPPTTFEQSVIQLSSPDPRSRLVAVTQIGKYSDAAAARLLATALHDSAVEVRREAAKWLAFWKSREQLPALLEAMGDPDIQVRRAAAGALESLGEPSHSAYGFSALNDSDEEVRLAAVNFLGRVRAIEAVDRLERLLLSDPSDKVRAGAANALALIGNTRAGAALAQALKDRSSAVQLQVVKAIAQLLYPYPPVGPALARILLQEQSTELREAAALALRAYPDKTNLAALKKAGHDRDKKVATVATLVLLQIAPDPSSAATLQAILAGPDAKIRLKAAQTLAELRDPRSGPALLQQLFAETDNQVKVALIQAAANLPPALYITEALLQLFDRQPAWQVQLLTPLLRSGDLRIVSPVGQALSVELGAGLLPGRDLPPEVLKQPDGAAQLLNKLMGKKVYLHNLQVGPLSRSLIEKFGEGSAWFFYQLLKTPDPLLRYFALKIFQEHPVINLSEAVSALASHENIAAISGEAGQLLVIMALDKGYREATPALVSLLKSELDTRIGPNLASLSFANPLEQRLARENWLKGPLGEALARRVTADNRWFFEPLLKESAPVLRLFGLQALLAKPAFQSNMIIMGLLDDDISLIRQIAIEILGQNRASEAAERVLECFERDSELAVKVAAAEALGQFKEERAVEPLIRALEINLASGVSEPANLFYRVNLIGAVSASLARIGTPRAQAALVKVLSNPANQANRLQYELVVALGLVEKPEPVVLDTLVEQLKKASSPTIRYYAALSLGKIGNASVIPALEWSYQHDRDSFGEDEDISWVYQAAETALKSIKNRAG